MRPSDTPDNIASSIMCSLKISPFHFRALYPVSYALYNPACSSMTFWKGAYYAVGDRNDISRMKPQQKSSVSPAQNKKADLGAKLSVLMQMLYSRIEICSSAPVTAVVIHSALYIWHQLFPPPLQPREANSWVYTCIPAPNIQKSLLLVWAVTVHI